MSQDRDKQWERVQIKGFTAWINSYLGTRGMAVENLQSDLTTGVRLCTFCEIIRDRSQDDAVHKFKIDRWEKNPTIRLHYINNVNVALKFIKEAIKVKLVAIGAEDIVDGNIKYILGTLWSVFRKLRNAQLGVEGEGREEEQALLQWVKNQTAGYRGVDIKGFKDSWHDGLALSALVHKFDPSLLDYDSIDPNNKEQNLLNAFAVAEKSMGIPQLLEAQDLMNCNPDERSVIFYISLFFHAFVANEDKRKLIDQSRATQQSMADLKAKLEAEAAARAEEERRRKELEAQIAALLKEIEDLKTRLRLAELLHKDDKAYLLEKIQALEELLKSEGAESAEAQERARRLRKELEDAYKAREELEELRRKLQAEGSSLLSELERAEEEKKRLRAELEELRKKIKAEMERRKRTSRAAIELERENAALKRQAILQGKARSGLEVLKRNLEEHLEDMYHWRQLHQLDQDVAAPDVFDLQKVLDELQKKSFEEQLDSLNSKLQAENINLQRIIRLKDKDAELKDAVDKQGFLEIRGTGKSKDWRKQWFVLRGPTLTYYKKEDDDRASGTIPMADVEFSEPKAEDDRKYLLAIKVGDKTVTLSASSRKERDEWRSMLQGAVVHLRYLDAIEKAKQPHRPDTRLINLFKSVNVPSVFLDGHQLRSEEIDALTTTLQTHNELEQLSLANASLGDSEISALAKTLSKVSFKILKLSSNNITSKGAVALAKAIADVKGVAEVHLDGNKIDDSGAEALAALLGSAKLVVFNLSNNEIGDKGAAAFAKAVAAGSSNLKDLNLGDNNIGDNGASAIADALKSKSSVIHVHLQSNNIGDNGASALAAALETNESVTELDISDNNVGVKGAAGLRNALKKSKSLHQINLSGNKNIVGGSELAGLTGDNFAFPNLTVVRRD